MALVVALIVVSPAIARFLRIPAIVVELILGMIIGRSILGLISSEADWLSTMATIGFIYLMFVVGLEVEIALLKTNLKKVVLISTASFVASLLMGYAVGIYFKLPALFIGVALSTTSMGVVLPTVKEFMHMEELAHVLLGSAIVVDILSMFALAYVIEAPIVGVMTVVLLLIAITLFTFLVYVARKFKGVRRLSLMIESKHYLGVRVSLATIFTFAIMAEFVGVHAIIGSFFAGLIISELMGDVEVLVERLLSFGYGFFIPIFFISVGINTDIVSLIFNVRYLEVFIALFIAGYIGKVAGIIPVCRLLGFNKIESLSMGFAMSARLSLIVAAAELGLKSGLIGLDVYSILVLIAILSVIISPSLSKYIIGKPSVVIPEEELPP